MSLLSGDNGAALDYLPTDSRSSRRFFHSSAVWDPTRKTVILRDDYALGGVNGVRSVGEVMERGGGGDVDMADASQGEDEWRDADVPISVES